MGLGLNLARYIEMTRCAAFLQSLQTILLPNNAYNSEIVFDFISSYITDSLQPCLSVLKWRYIVVSA